MQKICLITGCSSGFGFLFVKYLSKKHRVIATVRNPQSILDLKNTFSPSELKNIDIQLLDVTKTTSIKPCLSYIKKQYGKIDVLVNNAGYGLGGFFEDLTEHEIRNQLETNFFGLQSVTREALPLLRKIKGSKIINISSIAGLVGSPGLSAYNASKWAVEGFSESLYFEVLPFDIYVVLIEPGPFKTKILTENVHLASNIKNPQSPYFMQSQKLLNKLNLVVDKLLDDPKKVAQLVDRIVEERQPSFRYVIGKTAKLRYWLKRFLPFSLYSYFVKKAYN